MKIIRKCGLMEIANNILKLREIIPSRVTVIAISKTRSIAEILEAYNAGLRDFGENKVQELINKIPQLPSDIRWHFVGHLQTNKVKYLAPSIHLIQSVDSLKLMLEINREACKNNRIIDCLLQFYIASEETKFGFNLEEAQQMIRSVKFTSLTNVRIMGVMGMATYTDNVIQVRNEFRELLRIFTVLKREFFSIEAAFREVSMGMSDDFNLAIEEGSTMVRLGTLIFGERS
jgi:pyridoxal phosphate enzyme (YggS family)